MASAGFDLGFEEAGLVPVWQVEIDSTCQDVLARHWPNILRYKDVRDVHSASYIEAWHKTNQAKTKEVLQELAAVDIICAGFP